MPRILDAPITTVKVGLTSESLIVKPIMVPNIVGPPIPRVPSGLPHMAPQTALLGLGYILGAVASLELETVPELDSEIGNRQKTRSFYCFNAFETIFDVWWVLYAPEVPVLIEASLLPSNDSAPRMRAKRTSKRN